MNGVESQPGLLEESGGSSVGYSCQLPAASKLVVLTLTWRTRFELGLSSRSRDVVVRKLEIDGKDKVMADVKGRVKEEVEMSRSSSDDETGGVLARR